MTARQMVRDALTLRGQGHTGTAEFCAYDAGTSAGEARQPAETCPFDPDTHPDLAAAWQRGRTQAMDFQAGRTRRAMARRLAHRTPPIRYTGGTHAAYSHPEDA